MGITVTINPYLEQRLLFLSVKFSSVSSLALFCENKLSKNVVFLLILLPQWFQLSDRSRDIKKEGDGFFFETFDADVEEKIQRFSKIKRQNQIEMKQKKCGLCCLFVVFISLYIKKMIN